MIAAEARPEAPADVSAFVYVDTAEGGWHNPIVRS